MKPRLKGIEPIPLTHPVSAFMTTFARKLRCLPVLLMATATFALAACSNSADDRLNADLAPPERVDVLAPPMAPDINSMHPALQIAKSRGLKTNVYFNEELQQASARLQGMEETLGRLQNDLQGTAMAMQRVAMMRQEIDALSVRFQSLQERLMYAGPELGPAPEPMIATQPSSSVRTMNLPPLADDGAVVPPAGPTPLMGDLGADSGAPTAQISKPVIDEKKAPVKAATISKEGGVADVRIGTHPDSTRIVLDINGGKTAFTTNLDAGENVLTVELPQTPWNAAKSQMLKGNAMIASYSAQSSGAGSVVAFSLKGAAKIAGTKVYKAEGGKPARLVIDLAR